VTISPLLREHRLSVATSSRILHFRSRVLTITQNFESLYTYITHSLVYVSFTQKMLDCFAYDGAFKLKVFCLIKLYNTIKCYLHIPALDVYIWPQRAKFICISIPSDQNDILWRQKDTSKHALKADARHRLGRRGQTSPPNLQSTQFFLIDLQHHHNISSRGVSKQYKIGAIWKYQYNKSMICSKSPLLVENSRKNHHSYVAWRSDAYSTHKTFAGWKRHCL
jgi:hypothetical protein